MGTRDTRAPLIYKSCPPCRLSTKRPAFIIVYIQAPAVTMHFPSVVPALLALLSVLTLHSEPVVASVCCLSGVCGVRRHARDISVPAGLLEVREPVPAGCCCVAGNAQLCSSVCVSSLYVSCLPCAFG
jgi:hypothetical protein